MIISDQSPNQPIRNTVQLLVIISGPSGVGKDAVMDQLKLLDRPWHFVVTTTTRKKRPKEVAGVDYNFVTKDDFSRMAREGSFLEQAEVYGNWYGVPKEEVRKAILIGKHAILKLDIQGAATIRNILPTAISIFMVPATIQELESRLLKRSTENKVELDVRVNIARSELEHSEEFEYIVVNRESEIDRTTAYIDAIITAEMCKSVPRITSIL